jgi:hypothetical protein
MVESRTTTDWLSMDYPLLLSSGAVFLAGVGLIFVRRVTVPRQKFVDKWMWDGRTVASLPRKP